MNRTHYLFFLALLVALFALALVHPLSATSDTTSISSAGSSALTLSGTIVLDLGCDGQLDGEPRVSGKISVQIVDLRTNEVIATVDAETGHWTASVPIQGEYAVSIPRWISHQGYSPSPDGDSIFSVPSYTSSLLTGTTPAGPIGLCRIH